MSTTEKLEELKALIALLIPLHDASGCESLAKRARAAIGVSETGFDELAKMIGAAPVEFQRIEAPALDIDALLYKDRPMHANAKLERRIVANLLAWMEFKGWNVVEVFDGEEETKVTDAKAAMELIFNLDDVRVYLSNGKGALHSILLILGNGVDVISDWNFTADDPDGFNAAMSGFNAEDYE